MTDWQSCWKVLPPTLAISCSNTTEHRDVSSHKPKTSLNTRSFGKIQEALAARHLRKQGLKLVQSNYQCRAGEIDLVMLDPQCYLVFVEVRYRRCNTFGSAIASISVRKQQKLRRAASHFLLSHSQFSHLACRFDVVGINPSTKTTTLNFDWIKNAFV